MLRTEADPTSVQLITLLMTNHDKYLQPGDDKLPLGSKQVLISLGQLQSQEVIDQRCHYCDELIKGEALGQPPSAWRMTCACSKSNCTFRGL